jgi:hypothetical protein
VFVPELLFPALLFDRRKLGVKTRERAFQRSQSRLSVIQLMCAAELLQLKRCVDRGARAEVGDGSL